MRVEDLDKKICTRNITGKAVINYKRIVLYWTLAVGDQAYEILALISENSGFQF
jgi:hypothetical protein